MITKRKKKKVWEVEGDSLDFTHAGLVCAIRRMPSMGHLCGYVGVKRGHPLYGHPYGKPTKKLAKLWKKRKSQPIGKLSPFVVFCSAGKTEAELMSPEVCFTVHGGLTFSRFGDDSTESMLKNKKIWWFGFDCAHCDDLAPGILRFMPSMRGHGTYRNMEYVRTETEHLAEQLARC